MATTPTKQNSAIATIGYGVKRWLIADRGGRRFGDDKPWRDCAPPISGNRARRMPFMGAPHGH
jgi:hypothetical protein